MAEPYWVEGDVAPLLPGATVRLPLFEASPGAILFRFPGVGRFLVAQGETTVADFADRAGPEDNALHLRRPLDAARSLVDGTFSLQASAVALEDGATVVSAGSSMAASALAAALLVRGMHLVADQVVSYDPTATRVQSRADGLVLPQRVASALDLAADDVQPLRGAASVRSYAVRQAAGPVRVDRVFHVVRAIAGGATSSRALHGWEKIECLTRNCWLGPLIGPMGLGESHFAWAGIAAQVPVTLLTTNDPADVVADQLWEASLAG